MRLKKSGLCAALCGIALLTGCVSPLANKSADQAVRKIMLQNWNSKGYNIDADIGFDELNVAEVDKAKEDGGQLEQAAASAADQIARSMRLNVRAALDVPGGKLELIPALRLERRNLLTSVQLPLQFHAKDLSLLVDPSAAYLFVPEMQAYEGKFLRVRLPQRVADNFPLQAMYQAMPKLLDEAYAKVDKQAFSFQPLDSRAAELGARYRLRIAMNRAQENQMASHIIAGLIQVARQEAARKPQIKPGPLGSESLLQLIDSLIKASEANPLNSSTVSDLYVSRGGDLLAIRQTIRFDSPRFRGQAHADIRYSNQGKPVFAFQPAEADILDLERLDKPEWLKSLGLALHALNQAPAADDEGAAAATPDASAAQ
ncbi:hypothetical protein JD974_06520 [Chromobacterium haemolyticum]|uniref:Lipoprotein n=1 Tax=Chromobacterium haemolyticum TaxID=394935 RepID=A0ABS3GJY3_9NEIS|nr:hypothetical protein [Chromobacterium haemolyticum]MBK0414059.1 hypothetical protein [Chromobacterium haemolyticum]MBO0415254.1 hypothetical protein [Chromobacterium haemolyticum]MBO0498515.1 hypothetical protein [Chromobacterium haemolyticum]MDH0344304.1 hypothetical protein [Chromobacterium haemolyticum]